VHLAVVTVEEEVLGQVPAMKLAVREVLVAHLGVVEAVVLLAIMGTPAMMLVQAEQGLLGRCEYGLGNS